MVMMETNNNRVKSYWKIILEFSEQNVRFLMWWFLLPGLFLLVPAEIITVLRLDWFYNYFGWLFGLALMGSSTLLFIDIGYWIGFNVQAYFHIKHLASDEKSVLLGYTANNTQTQTLRIDSGTVATLLEMRILRMASNVTYNYGPFDIRGEYIIKPWVHKYLEKHPDLLKSGVIVEEALPVN